MYVYYYSYNYKQGDNCMRTVQMTLDENLIQTVDKVVKQRHTTRSAFTREALEQAIARIKMERLEEKHRNGYIRKPETDDEFEVWRRQQKWVMNEARRCSLGSSSRNRIKTGPLPILTETHHPAPKRSDCCAYYVNHKGHSSEGRWRPGRHAR